MRVTDFRRHSGWVSGLVERREKVERRVKYVGGLKGINVWR